MGLGRGPRGRGKAQQRKQVRSKVLYRTGFGHDGFHGQGLKLPSSGGRHTGIQEKDPDLPGLGEIPHRSAELDDLGARLPCIEDEKVWLVNA